MNLRNKKTGGKGYLYANKDANYNVLDADDKVLAVYPSLAELSEDWEDYEEPKKYWYIGDRGEIFPEIVENPGHIWHQARKEIGNYFETEEEAEKAAEKLKAWKRLKDKGLELNHWKESPLRLKPSCFVITGHIDIDHEVRASLDLLFGDEE